MNIKGRETKGAPSPDLLVCFPSRAHLTLMPKPISSPARPSEPGRHHRSRNHHHHHHQRHIKKSSTRGGASQSSPLLWSKTKHMGSDIAEPTSPEVTCVGQIKVRPKGSSCKSWQSVVQEIERIHSKGKHKKRSTWTESLGFKKEVMQFLTCLRSIRFDFRCFGSFPRADITSDDEEEDEEHQEFSEIHSGAQGIDGSEGSRTAFSKWFVMLQENETIGLCSEGSKEEERTRRNDQPLGAPSVPPANALLLMRCRSAPAKSWLQEKYEEDEKGDEEGEDGYNTEIDVQTGKKEENRARNLKTLTEEDKINSQKESLVVMRYDPGLYNISTDIAKETWVVGGMKDVLSRSQSWKR